MPLRGKKPEQTTPRLKLLMSGKAGVGKTTAAIQMPRPYLIDCEHGADHYGEQIERAGGLVYQCSSPDDLIQEVRAFVSERHEFLTLIVDPFTSMHDVMVEEGERKVGSDWGRHYGYAGGWAKRLVGLLATADVNVIVTTHAKAEYSVVTNDRGKKETVQTGETFDGWKKLDYIFDLWLRLQFGDDRTSRTAEVAKTRLAAFPPGDRFQWSYQAVVERYGQDKLEGKVTPVILATAEHVKRFSDLYERLNQDEIKRLRIDKVIDSADAIADLPDARCMSGIEVLERYFDDGAKKSPF